MIPMQQQIAEAVEAVRNAWQASGDNIEQVPKVIITTGSGLGALVERISPGSFEMSYDDIPHLPASEMVGHAGRLMIGRYGNPEGTKVVMLDGRVHGYEGHGPLTQALPFLIANQLCGGARLAISTNASGAINEGYEVGQLVLIADHINFTGATLLTLNAQSDFGGENLDMTFTYTPAHREALLKLASPNLKLDEGVYIGVKGAMFETPAEIRAFRAWGADLVGMSTIHEVLAASRMGVEVVGISVVTNMAAGIKAQKLTYEEVLENTAIAASGLAQLIADFLEHTYQ